MRCGAASRTPESTGTRCAITRARPRPRRPSTSLLGTALALAITLRHRISVHSRAQLRRRPDGACSQARDRCALPVRHARPVGRRTRRWRICGRRAARLYRAAKNVERRLLLGADHVVTLTHASELEIRRFDYLAAQDAADHRHSDLRRPRPLSHPAPAPGPTRSCSATSGSVGTWYLLDEMLRCFVLLREQVPEARLLIVNRGEHPLIRRACRRARHCSGGAGAGRRVARRGARADRAHERGHGAHQAGLFEDRQRSDQAWRISRVRGSVPRQCRRRRCRGSCSRGAAWEWRCAIFPMLICAQGLSRLVALVRDDAVQQRCRETALELFSLERGVGQL